MTTLTNDAVLATSELLGVQTLPLVLEVGPRQDEIGAFLAARETALTGLRTAGLIDPHDEVDADLAAALFTLAQPERELAARIFTETGTRRVCLARRGAQHAVAIRDGDAIDVRTAWSDGEGATLARPVFEALGPAAPAAVASFSAPSDELRDKLDQAAASSEFTQVVYDAGVREREAIEFGLAMASCHAHAEIVAYAYDDGLTTTSSGSVAVYDTARGRIVASPGAAPDFRVWTTFHPGSDHRIAQAISALVETLPGGRWLP